MKHEAGFSPPKPRQPTLEDFTRAKAEYASGYGVDHIVVSQWLRTWGRPGQVKFAEWLASQDG
jgi:hypothetical protein